MAEQTNLNLSKDERELLEKLEAALAASRDKDTTDAVDLCKIYQTIKPFLPGLVLLIRKRFPEVADAIEFLMKIADKLCPEG